MPKNVNLHAAIVRPVLDAELARFKAIMRQVARYELEEDQAAMFLNDDNTRFGRLAILGVYGHQPGIAAHIKTTEEEDQRIVEAIILQKVGGTAKTVQAYRDFRRARNQGANELFRARIARFATKTIVRWKRHVDETAETTMREDSSGIAPSKPPYTSRLLSCSRCNHAQETRWMQLRTSYGFRAIHCKHCGVQERTARTKCQCGLTWHHCPIHRMDPPIHSSRKGVKKATGTKEKCQVGRNCPLGTSPGFRK